NLREELVVETLRIVHQVARMHLEEFRQHHPRPIGQVRAGTAFNLREIRLADRLPQFLPYGANDFLLRHFTAEATQGTFNRSQVAYFFSQSHLVSIANRDTSIAK